MIIKQLPLSTFYFFLIIDFLLGRAPFANAHGSVFGSKSAGFPPAPSRSQLARAELFKSKIESKKWKERKGHDCSKKSQSLIFFFENLID